MRSFIFRLVPVLLLLAGGLTGPVHAADFSLSQPRPQPQQQQQQGANAMSIAAVVNEDIITVYDVQSRLGLVLTTSGFENTPDVQRRLLPQIVDALIEDHIKLQEARRLKISVSESDIRGQVDSIEQRNGMAPGAFRDMLLSWGHHPLFPAMIGTAAAMMALGGFRGPR